MAESSASSSATAGDQMQAEPEASEASQAEQEASQDASESYTAARTTMLKKKQEEGIKQEYRESGQQSNRSRSSSRRDRRKRLRQEQDSGTRMKTAPLESLEEADANKELMAMQPFDRIGPDSTSMNGPVTKARAERGEIPMRGYDPDQPYQKDAKAATNGESLQEQDGLKLRIEANLEIEIELKASIRGDLTLALLS